MWGGENIRLEPGWSRRELRLMLRFRKVGRAEIQPESQTLHKINLSVTCLII